MFIVLAILQILFGLARGLKCYQSIHFVDTDKKHVIADCQPFSACSNMNVLYTHGINQDRQSALRVRGCLRGKKTRSLVPSRFSSIDRQTRVLNFSQQLPQRVLHQEHGARDSLLQTWQKRNNPIEENRAQLLPG